MLIKKKLLLKILLLSSFSFIPISLSSCSKNSHNDNSLIENITENSFLSDVIDNTSYYFSFDNDPILSFDPKKDYSIAVKYGKDEIDKFQEKQKIFLKMKCSKEFYQKKVGTIFCLPLITKITVKHGDWNKENIKEYQKDLFKYPLTIKDDNKNDKSKIKEIMIEFTKEQIEKINEINNFDIGQKEYEIIFIISVFSKSLSFSIDDLEKQKNNIGAKNANIFLHLKLEKNNNN